MATAAAAAAAAVASLRRVAIATLVLRTVLHEKVLNVHAMRAQRSSNLLGVPRSKGGHGLSRTQLLRRGKLVRRVQGRQQARLQLLQPLAAR
jgi:hypothetical protein